MRKGRREGCDRGFLKIGLDNIGMIRLRSDKEGEVRRF